MPNLTKSEQRILKLASTWKTQRQLHAHRETLNGLIAKGLLRRKLKDNTPNTQPELGSVYKASEAS